MYLGGRIPRNPETTKPHMRLIESSVPCSGYCILDLSPSW
jgi:hypothetical protein